VLGPAGFYGKEWFDSFLQNVGPAVIDGVTHHIYNLGAGMYIFNNLSISFTYFLRSHIYAKLK
jgi:hypothetical protein